MYKKLRTKFGQEAAAAKTGISVRSARRLDSTDALPSQRASRTWRTRADPFESVWQSEIVPLLEATPALMAKTLLEEIQRRHPGQYDDALLRTLQRRVRTWCASHGGEHEVFFAQEHPADRLGLSDFTHARSVLRDALFPRTEYRLMWAQLKEQLPEAGACRLMMGLLDLAGDGDCEAALAERLALLLDSGELPDLEQLRLELAPRPAHYLDVAVTPPDLAAYDQLLEAA